MLNNLNIDGKTPRLHNKNETTEKLNAKIEAGQRISTITTLSENVPAHPDLLDGFSFAQPGNLFAKIQESRDIGMNFLIPTVSFSGGLGVNPGKPAARHVQTQWTPKDAYALYATADNLAPDLFGPERSKQVGTTEWYRHECGFLTCDELAKLVAELEAQCQRGLTAEARAAFEDAVAERNRKLREAKETRMRAESDQVKKLYELWKAHYF